MPGAVRRRARRRAVSAAGHRVLPAAVSSHSRERRVVGRGFTEWTNVVQARPLFPGHYQPTIPGPLGYYDLRVPETRVAQAALAREYGIEAFCYYHYWFGGRRLLERPFNEVCASGNLTSRSAWLGRTRRGRGSGAGAPRSCAGGADLSRGRRLRCPFASLRRRSTIPATSGWTGGRCSSSTCRTSYRMLAASRNVWRTLAQASGLPGLYLVGRSRGTWYPTDHGFDATVSVTGHATFRESAPTRPPREVACRLVVRCAHEAVAVSPRSTRTADGLPTSPGSSIATLRPRLLSDSRTILGRHRQGWPAGHRVPRLHPRAVRRAVQARGGDGAR